MTRGLARAANAAARARGRGARRPRRRARRAPPPPRPARWRSRRACRRRAPRPPARRLLRLVVRLLGLGVGVVGALDRLLELGQRGGHVRARELLERLRGEVLVRRRPGGGHPLAGRQHEAQRVLLGGDHDERAAVELAGGGGGVDELPQPLDRLLGLAGVAVVDLQPAAAAVLAGLGDVGAQLVDDQPDPAHGEALDALAGRVYGELS